MKNLSNTNPKTEPAPGARIPRKTLTTGSRDEPMTGAQASYLKTLSEERDEPDAFAPDLTKAEGSKRIDALKAKHRSVGHR